MKTKAMVLIVLGILGIIFVATFDIITAKPVNDITGPKSIAGFIISGVLIAAGVYFLLKKPKS